MKSISAKSVATTSLPVIDILGLRSYRISDRDAVADAIHEACRDNGFFYITNHGVPSQLIDAVTHEMRNFFSLPLETKLALFQRQSEYHRGYEPIGFQTLDPGTKPDIKEGFDIGSTLRAVGADDRRYGVNLWPDDAPVFRQTMDNYFASMLSLSRLVLTGIGRSLGLADRYFDSFCRDPIATLRLLHYPQQSPSAATEIGAGAHTDWGAITILLQDENSGLQVWDGVNDWIHVPPVPGTYVVNLGNLMARWTKDYYRSTLHRVVNVSGQDRYSIPFFLDGPPDYMVSCLDTHRILNNPTNYPPVTTWDHVLEMQERART